MRSVAFVESLGKTPVVLEKEIPGFVSLGPGPAHGAVRTEDLTGIDIGYLTRKARYAETRDPADLPSRTVTALVEAGHLGRKTGRGFYTYDTAGA